MFLFLLYSQYTFPHKVGPRALHGQSHNNEKLIF